MKLSIILSKEQFLEKHEFWKKSELRDTYFFFNDEGDVLAFFSTPDENYFCLFLREDLDDMEVMAYMEDSIQCMGLLNLVHHAELMQGLIDSKSTFPEMKGDKHA